MYAHDWKSLESFLQVETIAFGVALIVGVLFVLLVSAALVQWLTLPILRLMEGYWKWPLKGLRRRMVNGVNQMLAKKGQEWDQLADQYEAGSLDAEGMERYVELDNSLDEYPLEPNLRMPTKIGNILRAAEEYPGRCYGLEIVTTWPRLWLALPKETKEELAEARRSLNESAQLFVWGILFVVWVIWAWWAVPVAVVVALVAYLRTQSTAKVYGKLLRATYDLNRFALYEGLHWPLPEGPQVEKAIGEMLTVYLKRNIAPRSCPPIRPGLYLSSRRKMSRSNRIRERVFL